MQDYDIIIYFIIMIDLDILNDYIELFHKYLYTNHSEIKYQYFVIKEIKLIHRVTTVNLETNDFKATKFLALSILLYKEEQPYELFYEYIPLKECEIIIRKAKIKKLLSNG